MANSEWRNLRRAVEIASIWMIVFLVGCRDDVVGSRNPQPDLITANDSTLTLGLFPGVVAYVTRQDSAGGVRVDTLRGSQAVDYRIGVVTGYEFQADSGYRDVDAMLDSVVVGNAGAVGPQTVGLLAASASPVFTLPPDAAELGDRYRDLLSAADRTTAYRTVRAAERALATRVGTEEARRLGALAFHLSLSIEEADSVEVMIAQLPDSVLAARDSGGTAALAVRSAARGRSSAIVGTVRPTVVLYINGIDTYDFENGYSTENLRNKSADVPGLAGAEFRGFYNRTAAVQPKAQRLCRLARRRIAALQQEGPTALRRSRLITLCNKVDDIVESGLQLANSFSGYGLPVQEDAGRFADVIEQYLNAGRKVMIVAHSQGNLMTMEALSALFARRPGRKQQTSDCIGVVSVASPSAAMQVSTSEGTSNPFRRVMIKGLEVKDIILRVPANSDQFAAPNGLSALYDQELQRQWWTRWFTTYRNITILKYDAALHALDRSYIGYPESRASIHQGMQQEATTMETACRGPAAALEAPDSVGVAVGTSYPVPARVADDRGATLEGYAIQWSSSDTSVASVAGGVISGRRRGQVTVSASATVGSAVVQKTIAVTVTGPVATITVLAPRTRLTRPDSVRLRAVARDASGARIDNAPIRWSAGFSYFARVDSLGLVYTQPGDGAREEKIYAMSGSVTGLISIGVLNPTVVIDSVARPILTRPESIQLRARVYDADGQLRPDAPVQWLSSSYYTTIDSTGRVTTKSGSGMYSENIFARSGTAQTYMTLQVSDPVVRIDSVPRRTLTRPETKQLGATVLDAYGAVRSDLAVRWASGDTNILTVDPGTGLVSTSVGRGSVTIFAYAGSGQSTLSLGATNPTVEVSPRSVIAGARLSVTVRNAYGEILTGLPTNWFSMDSYLIGVTSSGATYPVSSTRCGFTYVYANVMGSQDSAGVSIPKREGLSC